MIIGIDPDGDQKRKITKRMTTSQGWVTVGGQKFYSKSKWERNYARYLEWLLTRGAVKEWVYEPEEFWFEKIKRGVRSYRPDFRVVMKDGSVEFHEVKGWMDKKSKTKLKRMAKYYPEIALLVVDKDRMKAIRAWKGLIPEWEN